MTTFKKTIQVEKDMGSGWEDLPQTIEELPHFDKFQEFKQKMIADGKIIKWERTPLDEHGKCTIEIELDKPETYREITAFSRSLGNWKSGFRLYDLAHKELP